MNQSIYKVTVTRKEDNSLVRESFVMARSVFEAEDIVAYQLLGRSGKNFKTKLIHAS